jgi:hypothetical protein
VEELIWKGISLEVSLPILKGFLCEIREIFLIEDQL